MGLVRQLLSHGFLVAAIILALLAYIFRGDLFTDNKVNALKGHSTEIEKHVSADGTAVVMTAEQAVEEIELSKQSEESAAKLSDNQSAYRPATDPEPVHVDLEEEIKKIAPPPVDPEVGQSSSHVLEVQDTNSTELPLRSDTVISLNDSPASQSKSTEAVGTAEDVKEGSASSTATATQVGLAVTQPKYVDEETYGVDKKSATSSSLATADDEHVDHASQGQPVSPFQGAYGPVYGRPSPGRAEQGNLPAETETQKVLREAREAFWKGDIEASVEKYTALIATSGDNPDFYGELGNVYYANGKWTDAANMYYEAGSRLAEQKQYGPAMHMVSILRGLKSDKADALEKTVTEAAWPAQE